MKDRKKDNESLKTPEAATVHDYAAGSPALGGGRKSADKRRISKGFANRDTAQAWSDFPLSCAWKGTVARDFLHLFS
jgi:hypothetical protein